MIKTDVLILGSGIAGLSLAVKTAEAFPDLNITILSKNTALESNTNYAQGGIAIALDESGDSFERHIQDTLLAGDGIGNPDVTRKVISEGPARLQELLHWGVDFDRDPSGKLALGREGGHTTSRIVHYRDSTGNRIAEGLMHYLRSLINVEFFEFHFALELLTRKDPVTGKSTCTGVTAMDIKQERLVTFSSRITVLATGGAGQVYSNTTNPVIATGDGIAMAYRAGASIRDMEFVQFHPTAFYSLKDNPSFLISEAMRGFGAHLCTRDGDRFVFRYDQRGELASRDIISKAIHEVMTSSGEESVYLDCRHLPADKMKSHFPTIYERCLQKGFDLATDPIPVSPAAHYICGGIEVDIHGRTTIDNLFASGECSRTGLHGANRLASNSLLEALVYSHEIFEFIRNSIHTIPDPDLSPSSKACTNLPQDIHWIEWQRRYVRSLMSRDAGIVRSTNNLKKAQEELLYTKEKVALIQASTILSPALYELRNILDVATLIVNHSLQRKENRGTFFNTELVN